MTVVDHYRADDGDGDNADCDDDVNVGKSQSLTLLARSSSPHGSRLLNSIPVSGVFVGGSNNDASIITYFTLIGLF